MTKRRDRRQERREKRQDERAEVREAVFGYLAMRADMEEQDGRKLGDALLAFNWRPGQIILFNRLERQFELENPDIDIAAAWGDGTFIEKFMEWLSTVDWEKAMNLLMTLISFIVKLFV